MLEIETDFAMLTCNQNREWNGSVDMLDAGMSASPDVLLVGRDPIVHVYTDDILKRAGFQVHAITPWEARNMANNQLPGFPLIIFNNTVHSGEATQIGKQLRRHSPASKLLLILGAEMTRGNLSTFDCVLEGLAGPVTLVSEARRLILSALCAGAQTRHPLPSA